MGGATKIMKKYRPLLLSVLGFWLAILPWVLNYTHDDALYKSDTIIGAFLIVLGFCARYAPRRLFFATAAVCGVWLQLAPLFFWAKQPEMYLNDTLVGVVVIIFSCLSIKYYELEKDLGGSVPIGWSFNPSDFGPRVFTSCLALVCWFLARYLAFYQLGYIDHVIDPFFGEGTIQVITSNVSKMFPVSDAGLGAFVYTIEFLLGWMGGSRRWKTKPWLALLFGVLVVPAGMVSILLIVSQPIFVGAWCGICLVIAVCMLAMILITVPEVVAAIQFLHHARKREEDMWQVFWRGDLSADFAVPLAPTRRTWSSELGFAFPKTLVGSLLLGVGLMMAPVLFGIEKPGANILYLFGPFVVAFTVVAFSEVARSVRWINAIFGIIICITPWVWDGFSSLAAWLVSLAGFVLLLCSLPRGEIRERYGKW